MFRREARLGLRFSFLLSALFNKGFRYFDAGIETSTSPLPLQKRRFYRLFIAAAPFAINVN